MRLVGRFSQCLRIETEAAKVDPVGYVLPGWNPLRLALEIAWLDQLTKRCTFVGFARGYQTRGVRGADDAAVSGRFLAVLTGA